MKLSFKKEGALSQNYSIRINKQDIGSIRWNGELEMFWWSFTWQGTSIASGRDTLGEAKWAVKEAFAKLKGKA